MKLILSLLAAAGLYAGPLVLLANGSNSVHATCSNVAWGTKFLPGAANITLDLNATTYGFFYGGGSGSNGLAYTFTPTNVNNPSSLVFKLPIGAVGATANPKFKLPGANYNLIINALDAAGNVTSTGSPTYSFTVPACVVTQAPRPNTSNIEKMKQVK